jgi:hypothetical protein
LHFFVESPLVITPRAPASPHNQPYILKHLISARNCE